MNILQDLYPLFLRAIGGFLLALGITLGIIVGVSAGGNMVNKHKAQTVLTPAANR